MTDRPFLTVVRGDATAEEVAALTAVLAAVSSRAAAGPPAQRSRWSDKSSLLRKPVSHGPDAWLASARRGPG